MSIPGARHACTRRRSSAEDDEEWTVSSCRCVPISACSPSRSPSLACPSRWRRCSDPVACRSACSSSPSPTTNRQRCVRRLICKAGRGRRAARLRSRHGNQHSGGGRRGDGRLQSLRERRSTPTTSWYWTSSSGRARIRCAKASASSSTATTRSRPSARAAIRSSCRTATC